jgi:uncharacterized protein (DUF1778 family)
MHLTKKPMTKVVIFNASVRDVELLTLAAEQKEISRSDFLRQALRKEAARVLAGADNGGREERPE